MSGHKDDVRYYLCAITACDNIEQDLFYSIDFHQESINIELLSDVSHMDVNLYPKAINLCKTGERSYIETCYKDNNGNIVHVVRTAKDIVLIYYNAESSAAAEKIIHFKIKSLH